MVAGDAGRICQVGIDSLLGRFLFYEIVRIGLEAFRSLRKSYSITVMYRRQAAAQFTCILRRATSARQAIRLLFRVSRRLNIFRVFRFKVLTRGLFLRRLGGFRGLLVHVFSTVGRLGVLRDFFLRDCRCANGRFLVDRYIDFRFVKRCVISVLSGSGVNIGIVRILS